MHDIFQHDESFIRNDFILENMVTDIFMDVRDTATGLIMVTLYQINDEQVKIYSQKSNIYLADALFSCADGLIEQEVIHAFNEMLVIPRKLSDSEFVEINIKE